MQKYTTTWTRAARRATQGCCAALVVLAACGSTEPAIDSGAPPAGVFTTDALSYLATANGDFFGERRYTLAVISRYSNPTLRTIYLARCYPDSKSPIYGVQAMSSADPHGAGYDPVWACVGHDRQIAVAPGAIRVDTLTLTGPNAFDGISHQGFGVLEGRFRLIFGAQSCTGDGQCAVTDDALRYSNEFTVRK